MLYHIVCRSPRETTTSVGSDPSPQETPRLHEPSSQATESGSISPASFGLSPRCPEETSPGAPAAASPMTAVRSPQCQEDTSLRLPAGTIPGLPGRNPACQGETSPRMPAASCVGCSGRSAQCQGETSPRLPAGSSVSAPCTVGRLSTYQPGCPPLTTGTDLNVVLSDVTEEDTDLEDGHISPVEFAMD